MLSGSLSMQLYMYTDVCSYARVLWRVFAVSAGFHKWFKLKGGGGRVEHNKPAMLHRSLGGWGSVVLQTNVIYCCQRRGFFRVAYETLQRTDWLLCYTCSAALSILRAACVTSTSSFFPQHHNSYSADTVLVTYVCVCALL